MKIFLFFFFRPALMKKLTYLIDGEMILKYQLIPEELDALISVKSDEDLRHMFDEYNRHESRGTPRLQAFLFPENPVIIENPMEPQALEQRYLDAINGIVRPSTMHGGHNYKLSSSTNYTSYSMSSACSSPRSPESCTSDTINQEAMLQLQSYQNPRTPPHMHKVQSTPNLYNLNPQSQSPTHPQPQPQLPSHHQIQLQHHHHHYYQSCKQPQPNHHHHHHHLSYQPNKPPLDPHPHKGGMTDNLNKFRSNGRSESPRYHQVDQTSQYYYSTPKHSRGSSPASCCNKCRQFDEYSAAIDRRIDRTESLPPTPHSHSPHHSYLSAKGWDSAM